MNIPLNPNDTTERARETYYYTRNVSSGFDLARSLATAKNLAEVVELRAVYWREHLSSLAAQADEVRELSAALATDMAAPIKAHVSRSMEELREELTPKR